MYVKRNDIMRAMPFAKENICTLIHLIYNIIQGLCFLINRIWKLIHVSIIISGYGDHDRYME